MTAGEAMPSIGSGPDRRCLQQQLAGPEDDRNAVQVQLESAPPTAADHDAGLAIVVADLDLPQAVGVDVVDEAANQVAM